MLFDHPISWDTSYVCIFTLYINTILSITISIIQITIGVMR